MDLFIRAANEYRRDIDVIGSYRHQMAMYLSKTTSRSYETCMTFVRKQTGPGGSTPITDPEVGVLVRDRHGDRKQVVTTLQLFLEDVRANNEVLAPSLTSYISADVKESLLGVYISENKKHRGAAKKKKFQAAMEKNKLFVAIYEGLQSSLKIKNNSLSGAHVSSSTVLFNKTAHSTLTSTCRTAAGYGNANNEKFIAGSRHYWCPDEVKANIISIITHTDLAALEQVMMKHHLCYPSVDQIMCLIHYSSDMYWRDDDNMAVIYRLVVNLTPLERAAFAYVGDLYHLAKYNDTLMRQFIGRMSTKAVAGCDDPETYMKNTDGDMQAYIGLLCAAELKGRSISKVKESDDSNYAIVAATVKNIKDVIHEHDDLIRCLWVSDNMPSSVARVPDIVRRAVVTSDTDSTIFTTQHWTEWYCGQLDFTDTSKAVSATIVYLASQVIRHILAQLSANMGVVPRHLYMLQMKNEFIYPVFALTSRAKHYFAYVSAQEGNVYDEHDTQIRGVALRNSSIPPDIMAQAKQMMLSTMDIIISGGKIRLTEYVRYVGDVERAIAASIDEGSYRYFSTVTIKSPDAYKDAESSSNYIHYEMWEDVFASKYGHTQAPPYTAVKVSIDADNPTKLKQWLERMSDPAIAEAMKRWLEKRNRKYLTTLLLPEICLSACGIPPEITAGINRKDIIANLCDSFYLVLETIGLSLRNLERTRTASNTLW